MTTPDYDLFRPDENGVRRLERHRRWLAANCDHKYAVSEDIFIRAALRLCKPFNHPAVKERVVCVALQRVKRITDWMRERGLIFGAVMRRDWWRYGDGGRVWLYECVDGGWRLSPDRPGREDWDRSRYLGHRFSVLDRWKVRQMSRRRAGSKVRKLVIPPWADRNAIAEIYALAKYVTASTGIKHAVDHIYPIKGTTVCGLHVAENLQVIDARENSRKHNLHPDEFYKNHPTKIFHDACGRSPAKPRERILFNV